MYVTRLAEGAAAEWASRRDNASTADCRWVLRHYIASCDRPPPAAWRVLADAVHVDGSRVKDVRLRNGRSDSSHLPDK